MHEMAITQSIVDAVVERVGTARVTRVGLQIGALSGVEADSVRFCFDVVTRDTLLEGASLQIARPVGSGRCRDCGDRFRVDDPLPVCACGSVDIEVTGGQQVRVTDIEMEAAADVRNVRL
jgi:hydrogenase nickel incorporation protein HypA/HybF